MYIDASIVKGILTGFILSLPFGPVGIYCMEVTIVEGRWKGYISALGMVSIDVFYSLLALLFVQRLEPFILSYEHPLTFAVGLFLSFIALRKLRKPVHIKRVQHEFTSLMQGFLTFAAFSLANISSIAVIVLIFTSLRVFEQESMATMFQLLTGVLAGGAGLWFCTTTFLSRLRNQIEDSLLIKVSRIANICILILGIYLMLKIVVF